MGDKSPKATQKNKDQQKKKTDAVNKQKTAATAAKVVPKTGKK